MIFYKKEQGQGMVEYALLIALLAIVVIWVIAIMGDDVLLLYQRIIDAFPG